MTTDDAFSKINRRRLLGLAGRAGLLSLLPGQVMAAPGTRKPPASPVTEERVRYPEKPE